MAIVNEEQQKFSLSCEALAVCLSTSCWSACLDIRQALPVQLEFWFATVEGGMALNVVVSPLGTVIEHPPFIHRVPAHTT